jgi:hypothetical protein
MGKTITEIDEIRKVDEETVEIDRVTTITITTECKRVFIEQQIVDITAQKKAYDDLRDAEIAECVAILKEMDKLGIESKG